MVSGYLILGAVAVRGRNPHSPAMFSFSRRRARRRILMKRTALLGTAAIALFLVHPALAQNTDRRPESSGSYAAQSDRSQPVELKKDSSSAGQPAGRTENGKPEG